VKIAVSDPYAQFGGIVTFPPSSPHGLLHKVFNAHSKVAADRIIAPYELPTGDIPVEFINNRAFNAVAFISESKEYVGINVGAFNVYGLYSAAFMSDPKTFPMIGNPNLTAGELGKAHHWLGSPEDFSPAEHEIPVP
jgi:hypothetical protein